MANNVLLETGKLTDGHLPIFRSTTYRVIYKNTNKTTSMASGICERFARKKNNDVFMPSQCEPIISQIIMILVHINVMEFYTIQKGI